jgi:hypothetical protein
MSATPPPASADEALGRILSELGSLRADVHGMRETGDVRHRTVVNELAEVRAEARRAMETAADAKRLADTSSITMRDTQRALVDYTKGLVARQQSVETSLTLVKAETGEQTKSLKTLLDAETDRKTREDERKVLDEKRWKWVGRLTPLVLVVASIAGYLIGHWRP